MFNFKSTTTLGLCPFRLPGFPLERSNIKWIFWSKGLTARGLVLSALMKHLNLNNSAKDLDLKLLPDLVLRTEDSLMSLSIMSPVKVNKTVRNREHYIN